jgi:hypothetical protein
MSDKSNCTNLFLPPKPLASLMSNYKIQSLD